MSRFNVVFNLLFDYFSSDMSKREFFRTLFAMSTTIPEEKRPQSGDVKAQKLHEAKTADPLDTLNEDKIDNAIRRGPTKTFTKAVVQRLDRENLSLFLTLDSYDAVDKLVADASTLFPGITEDNYTDVLVDGLLDVLYEIGGLERPTAENTAFARNQSRSLKDKWGYSLLRDAQMACSNLGCSRSLVVSNGQGITQDVYEVGVIDPNKTVSINNMIALCPQCHAHLALNSTAASRRTLKTIRAQQQARTQSQNTLDSTALEQGLANVLTKLAGFKGDLVDASDIKMDPVTVSEKIDARQYFFLESMTRTMVTSYFTQVNQILQEFHTSGVLNVNKLRRQIKNLYEDLADKPTNEIIDAITLKIQRSTKQDYLYCQILVSYFVQTCDILEPLPVATGGVYAAAQ